MESRNNRPPTPNLKILKPYRSKLRRKQTKPEGRLWNRLRERQLGGYRFCRQYSVGMYILDFYCHACKLAVEADGGHHANPTQVAYDEARSNYLNKAGIQVLRFWNHDIIKSLDQVLSKILAELEAIGPPSPPKRNLPTQQSYLPPPPQAPQPQHAPLPPSQGGITTSP